MRMQFRKKSALEIQIWGFPAHRCHKAELDHPRTVCGRERKGNRVGVSNTKRLGAEEEWLRLEENKNGCLEGK